MSFLTDDNLTFHRFSDGTITFDSIRKKSTAYVDDMTPEMNKKPKLILREVSNVTDFSCINEHTMTPSTAATTPYGVWTVPTSDSLNSYTNNAALNLSDESPSFNNKPSYLTGRSIPPPQLTTPNGGNGSTLLANGSTMKLINTTSMEMNDDQATKQVSCNNVWYSTEIFSIFFFGVLLISLVPDLCEFKVFDDDCDCFVYVFLFRLVVVVRCWWSPSTWFNISSWNNSSFS